MILHAALFVLALQTPSDPMLVSADWLRQHLHDPNLVLFQLGTRAQYDSTHIPGAQFLELSEIAAPRGSGPVLELPDPAMLDSVLEARGVSDDSRIVVYWGSDWFSPTTRAYLTLYWAGLGAQTSVLDGGMPVWQRRGGPVTDEIPPVRRGRLTLHPRDDVIVTAAWVASHLNRPDVAIIDARNERFYMGNYVERAGEDRAGHIPGAYNIPFPTVADDSDLIKRPDVLRDLFHSVRADPGDTVVAYCHVGQQATAVWFAARLAGLTARLYDGSFTQWATLRQYPVER